MATLPDSIFSKALSSGASDVHVAVGSPVMYRVDGILVPQSKSVISEAEAQHFVKAAVGESMFKKLQETREVDIAYGLKGGLRMRVNCSYENGSLTLVARLIPTTIPTLEEIGLNELAPRLINHTEGLVLFTGPTGTGKSTSLAAILQHVSQQRAVNIVTLEDPIEFLFPKGQGIVRQRQLGQDFLSYAEALKRVLRQDPDIVMVGEMRDPETIAAALTLAETGHLIFATLHTPNAVQTIDRIIDVFPPYQQPQIRSQISLSLRAIVAQRLLPKEGGGRVAQREVLVNTAASANTIRDNRLQELKSVLQTSADLGMCSFEKDAKRLYKEGVISKETYELATSGD